MYLSLFRSALIIALSSVLFVACGNKEETPMDTPAAEAPVAAPVQEAAPAPAAEPGGYEPTEEERVPGITEPVAAAS